MQKEGTYENDIEQIKKEATATGEIELSLLDQQRTVSEHLATLKDQLAEMGEQDL